MSNDTDLLAELGLSSTAAAPAETAPTTEPVVTGAAGELAAPEAQTVTQSDVGNLADVLGDVSETAPATAPVEKAKRVEIVVNKQTLGVGLLPSRASFGGGATGPRGSKYDFAKLEAPVKNEAGEVTGYSYFTVQLTDVENADEKKLQGAIQAAVAAQNKGHKEKNEITRYVSRTNIDDKGAYTGSSVYRVDDTIDEDDK